jgi:hypothetical protein
MVLSELYCFAAQQTVAATNSLAHFDCGQKESPNA